MSVWISADSSHECRRTVPMSVWLSVDSSHECIDIRGQFPRVSEDSYHECRRTDPMSVGGQFP